jgi:hypothetical protein
MATHIIISNKDYIDVDGDFLISWADKGNAWQDAWCPNTVHAVIWNNLPGPNEIQSKDASTAMMTGNTDLSSTSDAVGSTTIADLLTWAETRKGQINSAQIDDGNALENAETAWIDAGNSASDFHSGNSATSSFFDWSKTWRDYDEHYS